MTNKITIASVIVALVAIVSAACLGFYEWSSHPMGVAGATSFGDSSLFFVVATSSPITVGNMTNTAASSTVVLPSSSGRTWAFLSNNSAFPVFCNYNGFQGTSTYPTTYPSPTGGFLIAASSTFLIGPPNAVYAGAVICATEGGTSTVFVEANQ